MRSIAHIRESDKQEQTIEEHLLGVQMLAERYGAKLNLRHVTGLAGLLHDLGKYNVRFIEYILAATDSSITDKPKRGSVDHSTAGGKLLYDFFHSKDNNSYKRRLAEIVGNAIISHHSYLHDFLNSSGSDYLRRVRDKALDEEEYELMKQTFFKKVMNEQEFHHYVNKATTELEQFLNKVEPTPKKISSLPATKYMFLCKFVFSALIDADRTNTRLFEQNRSEDPLIDTGQLFQDYYDKLMTEIHSLQKDGEAHSTIKLLRRNMSEQCERFACKPSGIYTLSIPTGGGKTLASLRYALRHALEYGKKRIIYIVPYTTIIEQNAQTVRKILNDEVNILEHHSNVIEGAFELDDEDQDGFITTEQKLKLAKDNWDAPIIFTTMVQFLNAFYANGSGNIRRLHNLCEAVIIFDEVQKVPTPCISLFNQALNFLKEYGQSTLVLCTATQPALDFVEQKLELSPDGEMIEKIDDVIQEFKRVEILDHASDQTFDNERLDEFVQNTLQDEGSVLVILNTKSVVKKLYEQMMEQQMKYDGGSVPIYHLSTSMCAAHRQAILEKVREHLHDKEKVICVSTQLIEAGVDISFDCVIRSLAGLDSIAQAAGRCNRHGKDTLRNVYVIDHEEENLMHLTEIRKGKEITKLILKDLQLNPSHHGGHLLSRQAMEFYFKKFYMKVKPDLNYFVKKVSRNMTDLLYSAKNDVDGFYQHYIRNNGGQHLPLFITNSYRTAAEHFHVIKEVTTSVIVPYGKGKEIITDLNGNGTIDDLTKVLREAQQYTVNLYKHELDELDRNGGLSSCLDGKVLVLKEGAYSEEFGVDIDNDSDMEFLGS
ncbi:CRISPR-associated helicase/endonuclease Cas3 [Paenibacillus assamensis]|uniref:CRISPR-associated helicase/endonuclease Cas3 n=1 Tax=Paenibacillus assamensis TaxID=311244 RepID=UPI00040BC907|nr:CRISPR-associated helicase/endonuclease Cas3 [Paenibacillus assamensis]